MYRATADIKLPTAIIGSLPRPTWYTENLGSRNFLTAMVNARYREQYVDALTAFLTEQQLAGLDIVTDGDCRFDTDVGGQSWTSYPPSHMAGFDRHNPKPVPSSPGKEHGLVSRRAHPARLSRIAAAAANRRPGRARRPAVRRAVADGAAADHQAGQVRHRHRRDHRPAGRRSPLQGRAHAHPRHQRRAAAKSCTSWRTPAAR